MTAERTESESHGDPFGPAMCRLFLRALAVQVERDGDADRARTLRACVIVIKKLSDDYSALQLEREALVKDCERRHRLIQLHHADAMELWKALNDMSFESDGVTCVLPPSRETYNRTFAIMQKHREAYSGKYRGSSPDAAILAGEKL